MKQKDTGDKNSNVEKKHRPYLAVLFGDKLRNILVAVGRVLYTVKASAAIVAIQTVLRIKMEGYVLRRLFTGKDTYHVGDISKAIVARYTGMEQYHFGDVTRATLSRMTGCDPRSQDNNEDGRVALSNFMRDFGTDKLLGSVGSKEMESMLCKITGNTDNEFGDVTKALLKRM